jgi:glycosyltransferase involved in cell wall biosynthesis
MPEVSIGMPVYNGARLLERALTSLLRQSFKDFELIISDNASTDATNDICQRFAREDRRIRHIRQARNIGAGNNFTYVLGQAQALHFMWAAHDDFWEPEFIAANYEALSTYPEVVLSVSQVEFINEQGEVVDVGPTGTYPLLDGPRQNLLRYLSVPAQNSRYYGLCRTEILRQCTHNACFMNVRSLFADDWLIMARTLKFGKHFEVNRCLLRRSPDGNNSNIPALIARLHKTALFRAMPMLPYTWAVLTDPLIPKTPAILWPFYRWNKYYADRLFMQWAQSFHAGCRRFKRIFVRDRSRLDQVCDAATVQTIQRLLVEPMIGDKPEIERYSQPGGVVDCNALLDIPSNDDFVDAAFRQVLGREITDKARRRWLRRLRWVSRAYMLVHLRSARGGKAHRANIPGLWRALFLNQPRQGWLRLPFADGILGVIRRNTVGRRCRNRLSGETRQPRHTSAAVYAGPPLATHADAPHSEFRKAS